MNPEIKYPPRNVTQILEPLFSVGGGFDDQTWPDVKTAETQMGRYLVATLRAYTKHYTDFASVKIPQAGQSAGQDIVVYFDEKGKPTGYKTRGNSRLFSLTPLETIALEQVRRENMSADQ